MIENASFEPDWVSSPGETIATLLEERGLSRVEFAASVSLSTDRAIDLIEGRSDAVRKVR